MYLHVSHVSELCTCGDRMHLNSIRYTMHLHMQARCKKLMQRFQRYASTYARYLHGICMMQIHKNPVFALYLHGSCMHMQVPCKYERPPLCSGGKKRTRKPLCRAVKNRQAPFTKHCFKQANMRFSKNKQKTGCF